MNLEESILIESYLRGTISTKDKEVLEQKMLQDKDFKEKVLFEKQLFETFSKDDWSYIENPNEQELKGYKELLLDAKTQDLKRTLDSLKETTTLQPKKKKNTWFYYAAAAVVIVSVGLSNFLNPSLDNEQLYTTYQAGTELPSLLERTSEPDAYLVTTQELFDNKDYKQTINHINTTLATAEKNKATLLLIKGISQTEIKEYDAALKTYDLLINSDLLDAEKGYWYKSLLYLKQNEIDKTKNTLNSIINNKYFNAANAKKLLEELE